jgi:gas vesicle protein
MDNNKRDLTIGILAGIAGGLVAGGILGILFAPKSGKETRTDIKDKTLELVEKVKALPADVRAKINKATVDDIKKK